MSDVKPRRKKPQDFAILGGPTEDGQGAQLLRFRGDSVSVGEIRPAREGEPITHSELVRLHPLDDGRRVCEVEVLHAPARASEEGGEPASQAARGNDAERAALARRGSEAPSRPARVSTERYRKNWDAIFDKGARRKGGWDVN